MAFTPPDYSVIRDNLLRDVANLAPEARIQDDSDWLIRANAVASAVEGVYQHQSWIARQIFPDTADSDILERHAAERGLSRKSATYASGTVTATGMAGSTMSAGLLLKTANDASYQTTAVATIGSDGMASVHVRALTAGVAGNLEAGTLTWQSPPAGVDGAATVVGVVGGTEAETDASLLARLLDLIRRPPAGGNKYDYRRWALSVDGVSAAYVYPLRRGLGTVDIVITSAAGLPSAEIIAAAQTYIDDVRPVTAKHSLVLGPTLRNLDHRMRIAPASGYTLTTSAPQVEAAIAGYFDTLAPGDHYVRSHLEKLISELPCVADREIAMPGGNVTAVIDENQVEWLRAGTITVELLA